jgi:hypothetical protein
LDNAVVFLRNEPVILKQAIVVVNGLDFAQYSSIEIEQLCGKLRNRF